MNHGLELWTLLLVVADIAEPHETALATGTRAVALVGLLTHLLVLRSRGG